MREQKKAPESSADEVPAYIVTFSDMITLLLTFFVMLLSLANVQDPELFNKGRDSLTESFNHSGLGLHKSTSFAAGYDDIKTKYATEENEEDAGRTIDEERERLRRNFEKIDQSMTTMPAQIQASNIKYEPTSIHFNGASIDLDQKAQSELSQFLSILRQTRSSNNTKLYVLAFAHDAGSKRQQFMLSAQRAQAVSTFLRNQLSPGWQIYNWGAGAGGSWKDSTGIAAKNSHVIIATLKD